MLDWIKRHKYLCITTIIGGFLGWMATTADTGVQLEKDVTKVVTEWEEAITNAE